MTKSVHPADEPIIKLLQGQGLIKSEVEARLKRDVYRLAPEEVNKIKNYAKHFGIDAKEKLIDEILDIRRESLVVHLNQIQQQMP